MSHNRSNGNKDSYLLGTEKTHVRKVSGARFIWGNTGTIDEEEI